MADLGSDQLLLKFIGVWRLLECTEVNTQGEITYPWGKNPMGYIIYTKEGIVSVQIMRKERSPFDHNTPFYDPATNDLSLAHDYNAYFARFTLDPATQHVFHTVEGHINPLKIGKKKIRAYEFYDNKLQLTTENEPTVRNLLWEKVETTS